jgi:hypothetical protein
VSAEPSALPAVMGPNPAVGPAALPLSISRSSRCGAGFPPPLRCAPHDLFPRRLPVFVWPMWTGVVAARQYRQPSELSQEVMITFKRFKRAIDACLYASGPNANLSWLFAFSALVDRDARGWIPFEPRAGENERYCRCWGRREATRIEPADLDERARSDIINEGACLSGPVDAHRGVSAGSSPRAVLRCSEALPPGFRILPGVAEGGHRSCRRFRWLRLTWRR